MSSIARNRLYVICSILSLGGYMYGYNSGALSACLVMNSFQTAFSLDQHGTHIIIAIPLTASCIGAMCSGLLADSIGRRKSFVVAGCIDLLGTLLQTVTKSYVLLLLGRIIAGFAVGILCSLVPLYQSEISLPELRGRLITLYQLGITLGFCVAFWTGYSTYGISSDISWRLPIYLQILPPVLFLAGLLLVPESPRWLIYQGQSEKALKILKSIRINKENSYQYNISMEYTGIIQNVNYDRRCSAEKLSSLWSRGIENNLKRTILGISMHVTTQFTGINTILLSIPILINNNGSNIAISPQLGQAIGGLLNMIATLPVFFYIDSFGRRKILITGALTMSLCMIVLAIITGAERGGAGSANLESVVGHHNDFFTSNSSSTLFILFFAILCAFIVCFSLSFGTLSWVYPAEIYTQLIRAKAIGVTTAASFCSQLFISELSPIMIHSSLLATYIFFGVMCIFIAWTVFCFYPETNGRSLEEIHLIFSGALIDQSAEAHHPATAAEALLKMAHIQYEHKKNRLRFMINPRKPSHAYISVSESGIIDRSDSLKVDFRRQTMASATAAPL